jgi:hypothetical protein
MSQGLVEQSFFVGSLSAPHSKAIAPAGSLTTRRAVPIPALTASEDPPNGFPRRLSHTVTDCDETSSPETGVQKLERN